MPIPTRKYRDLDLDFQAHPITGNLAVLEGPDAVRRSIRNLVLTSNYERFYRPWIGSIVHNSLFGLNTVVTQQQIKQSIEDVIKANEPRVDKILSVVVTLNTDRNGYDVTISFSIKNLLDPISLVLFLKRTR